MVRESASLKVPKFLGEKAIAIADKLSLRDSELEIQKDGDFLQIPLVRLPSETENAHFRECGWEPTVEVRVFQERRRQEKTLTEVLENVLPPHLLANLPHALDIVGDIAIVELSPELKAYEAQIGTAILETHRNLRTVLAKAGAVKGTYRLREFDVIAGAPRTLTVHKEFGCQYYVDVARAYFSPRLSHEHRRVASLIHMGETVVDLFAGVGPFSVLIAKNNNSVKVFALDINPEAFELLKKNILLNRVQSRVIPFFGDARRTVHDKLSGVADRVIMNLPESASEFVDVACKAIKPTGGVVHFYGFIRRLDSIDATKNRFEDAVKKSGRKVDKFLSSRIVRETAPYQSQIVLDALVV